MRKKMWIAWHRGIFRGVFWVGIVALPGLLQGCGSLSAGNGFSPSVADYKRAALSAVRDPNTWVPALGASVFLIRDWDQGLSDWARRENPLFGSEASARRASDVMMYASVGSALGSALLVPEVPEVPGIDDTPKSSARTQRFVVQLGAIAANGVATYALKHSMGRKRPDGSDEWSFPSGHASAAFTSATLTRRNLAQMGWQDSTRRALDVGFVSLAAVTAWARVEAGVHYPTDVLAGAALGNFVAAFVNDAFLREGALATRVTGVSVLPLRRGAVLQLTQRF